MLSHSLHLPRYHRALSCTGLTIREQSAYFPFTQFLQLEQPKRPASPSWSAIRGFASNNFPVHGGEEIAETSVDKSLKSYDTLRSDLGLVGAKLRDPPSTTDNWLSEIDKSNSGLKDGAPCDRERLAAGVDGYIGKHRDSSAAPVQSTRIRSVKNSVRGTTTQYHGYTARRGSMGYSNRNTHNAKMNSVKVVESSKYSLRCRSTFQRSKILFYRSRKPKRIVQNEVYTSTPGLVYLSLRAKAFYRNNGLAFGTNRNGRSFDVFHPTWSAAFASVNAPYRRTYFASKSAIPEFVFYFHRFVPGYHGLCLEGKIEGSISRAWNSRSFRGKKAWWQHALLFALHKSLPDAMLIAKDILRRRSLPVPSYVIEDVLDHIVAVSLAASSSKRKPNLREILAIAHKYLATYSKLTGFASLSQRTLWLLSRYCNADQLTNLIRRLDQSNAKITIHTKVQMMHRFVVLDRLGLAVELLETIPEEDISLDAVQSICILILRTNWEVENLYKLRQQLLNHMLKLGVCPNRHLHDTILLNAMEAGDRKTAWKSFQITLENGLEPSSFTYSALLKGVEHGDNLSTIDYIYQRSRRDGTLLADPVLATHLVYSIYLFNKANEEEAFGGMLALFQKLFDPSPLQELGILDQPKGSGSLGGGPMRAPMHALTCMILAWLEENHANVDQVQYVYDRFLLNIKAQHPRIAPLAEDAMVFNGFLKAFGRHRHSLHICTNIVQDMVKLSVSEKNTLQGSDTKDSTSYPYDAASNNSRMSISPQGQDETFPISRETNATTMPPVPGLTSLPKMFQAVPPDVFSWSILLLAFMRHRQVGAAEKVLRIMKVRDIEPDQVTWKNLISGYVHMQQPEAVVDAVWRMEKARFKADDWTMKMLSLVEDRDRLLQSFERAVRIKAEADRKAKEEEAELASQCVQTRGMDEME